MENNRLVTNFKTTGILVARFQVPDLHEGHHRLIKKVKQYHKKIFLFLGVAPMPTDKNPLDFPTRVKMISNHYPDLTIVPITDVNDDTLWVKNLEATIRAVEPKNQVILYGSRDSFIKYYKDNGGRFETVDVLPEIDMSGTELREEICNEVKDSADFRAGIIYHLHNTYPKVIPTVDIAIYRFFNNNIEILLGRKPDEENKNLWRIPGGFIEKKHNGGINAAIAEAEEETNVKILKEGLQFITQANINDWRLKGTRDTIMTTLFAYQYVNPWNDNNSGGFPKAGDDLSSLKWFTLTEAVKVIRDEHRQIFDSFKDYVLQLPQPSLV
jgi:bifunctional NMN adenylyltransferase/nudix hydrolase